MKSEQIEEKGILAKLLEQSIKFLLKKECKKISNIKIDIVASSIEIIKGIIRKINIRAEEINYKDLLFDEIELEANKVKLNFKITSKELKFKNNFIINFKISLSEKSLENILLSKNWHWIGKMITNEMSLQDKLESLTIKNGQILINTSKDNNIIKEGEKFDIRTENGNLYLENKAFNKSMKIPIEDKVCIKRVNIENNLINIFANSSISF